MLAVHQFQVPILPKKMLCKLPGVHPQFSQGSAVQGWQISTQGSMTVLLLCGGWQGYMHGHTRTCCDEKGCMGSRKKVEDDDPIPSPVRQISSSPVGISIDLLPTIRDRRRCLGLGGWPVRPPHSRIWIASLISSADAGA
jgi:hypothetical protein